MRDIAGVAGVSAMTVSKALRNSSKISVCTRNRILHIAGQVGYRPDPEVGKLMSHLRRRDKPVLHGLICAVTDRRSDLDHPFVQGLVKGARRQAEARGHSFDLVPWGGNDGDRQQLRRQLWTRGTQGVLFLPLEKSSDFSALLEWNDIAAIAATSSLRSPDLHRVMPSHYVNTAQLCLHLHAQGYRRLGLIMDGDHDARVQDAFSAAVIAHQYRIGVAMVPPFHLGNKSSAQLKSWYRRERPDAIIARDDLSVRTFAALLDLEIGGQVGWASTSTSLGAGVAGIDERAEEIGATAVDRLAVMIQHGELGAPKVSTTTLVAGQWVDAPSCPARL